MRMQHFTLLLCALALFLAPAISLAGSAEEDAVEAAKAWLALTDSSEYQESWKQ